jgi:RNA polymerase sigma-70 factor (ECF subfamily)
MPMPDSTTDSAETRRLLELVRLGDRHAFGELFAQHRPYLSQVVELRLDHQLRSRVDPSDIVQETQMEAFRRLPDFLRRQPMPFRLWLRKTACEQLLMMQRRHLGAARRAVGREMPLPERSSLLLVRPFLAAGSTPSQRLGRRELAEQVRQALAELSAGDREVLLMRNLEALSNHEVAQVLEIDPGAASQRYGRALLRLRQRLAERGLIGEEP